MGAPRRQIHTPPTPIDHRTVIIVEGDDDKNFIRALCRFLQLPQCQFIVANGKPNIPNVVRVLPLTPNFEMMESLCIVRDADNTASGALQSIRHALSRSNLPTPTSAFTPIRPPPGNALSVSIALFPDGHRPGSLEDLCLSSVQNTPEMTCVDSYIVCAQALGSLTTNVSKAKVQAYLATKQTGISLGNAANNGHWNWQSPAFQQLSTLLQQIVV